MIIMVCEYKNSISYRLRDTPSFDAGKCPYKERAGKNVSDNGTPSRYISLPHVVKSKKKKPYKAFKWYKVSDVLAGRLPKRVLVPAKYKQTCIYKNSKSMRLKNVPSYSPHGCPYKKRLGKDIEDGKPRVYISLPRRTRHGEIHWKWYPYSDYTLKQLPKNVIL
jgi:hypothetical protein